jgi:hypothetical protein
MTDHENTPPKVEDLDQPLTDAKAEQVKGGVNLPPITNTAPKLVKKSDSRTIIPCV